MIGTLMDAFARQRLASPMRLVLAFVVLLLGVAPALVTGSLEVLGSNTMDPFAFVFAFGLIGQDVSSGVLTLAFARPVRRGDYVLARWLGASVLATMGVLLEVLAATGAVVLRHGEPSVTLMASKFLLGTFAAFGLSAVILMLSSLVPGLGDLGVYLLARIGGGLLSMAGVYWQAGWLSRAGEEALRFLDASLDPIPWLGHGPVSWFAVTSYLSTLTISIVVAMWAVNRKELSYASG